MSLIFRILSCVTCLSLSVLTSNSAFSQGADVSKGRDLAIKHCAGCHKMSGERGRERNGRYVPSFPVIANTPHYSLVRLRRIVAVPPHREMPKAPLNNSKINDIAHFIQTLRK